MKIIHTERLMFKQTNEQTTQQTVCMGYWHHAIIIIIIIIIITNHHIQNPFSLKEEAPNLSRHNVSYNINKTGEQPVQLISSLGLYL